MRAAVQSWQVGSSALHSNMKIQIFHLVIPQPLECLFLIPSVIVLMAESKEELKSLLMKVKEESEKIGLKLSIQKMIMASCSVTSRQIDGETMETMRDIIFLGSKITADGDCSHEIERLLLLGRQATTNLDSVLKKHWLLLCRQRSI